MSKEFDIDTPPDMELLAGTPDDEHEQVEPVAEEPAAAAEQVAAEPAAEPAQEEDQEEAPQSKRDPVIPRARFDEVNAKLHAAREEAEQLRAALAARESAPQAKEAPIDVDALEDAYFEAILEGDKDKAKTIRAQINAEIYQKAEAVSAETVAKRITEREVQSSFAQAVSHTVEAYPFLDSNSPDANAEAIADVVEWRDFYISKGEAPAIALQRAANKVAPLYSKQSEPVAEPVVDKRKQQALVNGAKAAAAQPPRVDAGVGNRTIPSGDSIIGNQEKWERASEAERLRYLQ